MSSKPRAKVSVESNRLKSKSMPLGVCLSAPRELHKVVRESGMVSISTVCTVILNIVVLIRKRERVNVG